MRALDPGPGSRGDRPQNALGPNHLEGALNQLTARAQKEPATAQGLGCYEATTFSLLKTSHSLRWILNRHSPQWVQVSICNTVDSALEGAQERAITAAIIDLRLHGQSVRQVVDRLASRKLPFLFYTGQAETPTAASWPACSIPSQTPPSQEVVDTWRRLPPPGRGLASEDERAIPTNIGELPR